MLSEGSSAHGWLWALCAMKDVGGLEGSLNLFGCLGGMYQNLLVFEHCNSGVKGSAVLTLSICESCDYENQILANGYCQLRLSNVFKQTNKDHIQVVI